LGHWLKRPILESFLHRWFGTWASRELRKSQWDVIHVWSGVANEIFDKDQNKTNLKLLGRFSAHILAQSKILEEEEKRVKISLERPTPWKITRELEEYRKADHILVLSAASLSTFLDKGIPREKLSLLLLGTNLQRFRASREIIDNRQQRILKGEPLRALYVGALSFRKGFFDLIKIVEQLKGENFKWRLVGPISQETKHSLSRLPHSVELIPKQEEHRLSNIYAWGDIFIFPTIEDGFAQVLLQAQAGALPIIASKNCAGPDLIQEDITGWTLPIRQPNAFIERLLWCGQHRNELAKMTERIFKEFKPKDWSETAEEFEKICRNILK